MLKFYELSEDNYMQFKDMMLEYYREGEDEDTEQTIIEDFIRKLYSMVEDNKIEGRIIYEDTQLVGFVLWMMDIENSEFSEMPGYGTFLEIGINKENRRKGIGRCVVADIENRMMGQGIDKFYVSAYGPAETFWKKCGYVKTIKKASNELFLYEKIITV